MIFNIEESLLVENIPRDLLAAYKKAQGYASQRNPNTSHSELDAEYPNLRRKINYAYGSSSYEVISPEDAIRMVQRDKESISKLRILFAGNLVEYELRDNGSIYAIYGDSSAGVDIGDKHYRNVRYVPWKQVFMHSDKIYVTDEYEHYLAPDSPERQNTKWKKRVYIHSSTTPKDAPEYDGHNSYNNFTRQEHGYLELPMQPDTGDHTQRYGGHGGETNWLLRRLSRFRAILSERKYSLTNIRKALQKLEREKDSYSEEQYQEYFEALKERYDQMNQAYLETRSDVRKLLDHAYSSYLKQADDFHRKKIEYARQVTYALLQGYELQKYLQGIQRAVAHRGFSLSPENNDSLLKAIRASSSFQDWLNKKISWNTSDDRTAVVTRVVTDIQIRTRQLEEKLQETISSLEALQGKLDSSESEAQVNRPETEQQIQNLLTAAAEQYEELEKEYEASINVQQRIIREIKDELNRIQQVLDELQPSRAARIAADRAREKKADIPAGLEEIIDFEDFVGNPEDGPSEEAS